MKPEELEFCTETLIHEDVVRKAVASQPAEELLADLADLFKNFSDTTRIRILSLLIDNEMCVCDIANVLSMSHSAVSHQLRILRHTGIVAPTKEGKTVYYRLADEHIRDIYNIALTHIKHLASEGF